MIKAEQVPDKVVKAALLTDERLGMREVLVAALNAWPGMDTRPNIYGRQDAILILPLTENSNERE